MHKNLLKSKMSLYGHTQIDLAKILGLSHPRTSQKINETNRAQFTQREIQTIKENYNLSNDEVADIFFNPSVSCEDTVQSAT